MRSGPGGTARSWQHPKEEIQVRGAGCIQETKPFLLMPVSELLPLIELILSNRKTFAEPPKNRNLHGNRYATDKVNDRAVIIGMDMAGQGGTTDRAGLLFRLKRVHVCIKQRFRRFFYTN